MIANTLQQQLRELITEILHEERYFQTRARQMHLDQGTLDARHVQVMRTGKLTPAHDRLKRVHDAMFKAHRRVARDHHGVVTSCRRIADGLGAGTVSERQITLELDHLRSVLKAMKAEHATVEAERRRIDREHAAYVRSISGGR